MSISLRELFTRQNIEGEAISLRHSLANHYQGLQLGLREAHQRFLQHTDGNGFARGCLRPDTVKIDYGFGERALGEILPAWVAVVDDAAGETRTLEGILTESKAPSNDFPFKPWHTRYDWNLDVRLDRQYTYLHSQSNLQDHGGVMECEWDTAYFPIWAFPQSGDRVWVVGRWIYDCGHPEAHGHKSELHPIKAIASFRQEAAQFVGNRRPTQANTAVLFIGREGGYWQQPINDQNYAFDLHLPPKPYEEAVPVWTIQPKTGQPQTGALPVAPQITPYPASAPKSLRIVIPLKGVEPHPNNYGAIISGGWSDPRGTESNKTQSFRVTIEEIFMDANLDPIGADEWYVYIGVNGRWQLWSSLGGKSRRLDYVVDLNLHPSDRIHITATGREADEINDLIGKDIGLSWAAVSDRTKLTENAKKIRSGFLKLGPKLVAGIENEAISVFSEYHSPSPLSSVVVTSPKKDYRLRYKIEAL